LKEQLHGITIENRWPFAADAGANWRDQRGGNRAVAFKIVATWACC
jgi:hypothetical protein